MHCPNCGHALPDGAEFCTNCGTKIEVASEAPAQQPSSESVTAPVAEQPSGGKSGGWQNSMAFKIVSLVVGIALIVLGVMRMAQGFGCSRKQEPAPEPQTLNTTTNTDDKDSKHTTTDSNGYLTLYALSELDGKEVHEIMSDVDYDQIASDDEILFTPNSNEYMVLIYVGKDEHNIGFDELDKLKVGGKGEPVHFEMACGVYESIKETMENLGQLDFEEIEYTDDVAYGIAKNSAGDKFLIYSLTTPKGAVVLKMYNEDYFASGLMPDLGSTVEEVFEALDAELGSGSTSSSSKLGVDAAEVDLK